MGTDCYICTNGKTELLDRWYVFDSRVEAGKEYSPKEFLAILDQLEADISVAEADGTAYRPEHKRFWIQKARSFVTDSPVVMWDEHSIPDEIRNTG